MKLKKPYYLFFIATLVFSILMFFSNNQNSSNINIHATYFVVGNADLYFFFMVFNLIIGLVYLMIQLFRIKLNQFLYNAYIYSTLVLQLIFFFYNYKNNAEDQFNIFDTVDYNTRLIIVLLTMILIQILLIINIFATLIIKTQFFSNSAPQKNEQ